MKPDRIGQFEIVAEIAAWEGGAVYKATDAKSKTVLLRTLRMDAPGAAERVMHISVAAKSAHGLSSPNIAGVLGGGKAGDVFLVAWEFVEGVKLSTTLEKGQPLSHSEFTDLSRQICFGLDHAHSKGVVHPELKPGNIILEWDGTAKMLDFGMPRKLLGVELSEFLYYTSPEDVQGKQPGPRANFFTWGAILYQMVTGQRPFRGETAEALKRQILEHTPPAPHEVKKDVHPGLSQIIMKALAKVPADRYASGAELVRDLENYKQLQPGKPPEPAPKPVKPPPPAVVRAPSPPPPAAPPPAPTPAAVKISAPPAPAAISPPAATPTAAPAAIPAAPLSDQPAPSPPLSVPEAEATAPPATRVVATPTAKPEAAAAAKPAAAAHIAVPPKLVYAMGGAIVLLLVVLIGAVLWRGGSGKEDAAATTATTPAAPATSVPVSTETTPTTTPPAGTPDTATPAVGTLPPSSEPSSSATKAGKAKPEPEPPKPVAVVTGELAIESTPPGAEIQIDGRHEAAWITPYTAALPPGQHAVTMTMPGRMSVTRTVDVAAGKKVVVAAGLAERAATISVSSDPAGATILLDGQNTGKVTPADLILAKGSHTVLVRKQNYLDASSTMDLAPGQSAQFAPTLKLSGSTADIKTAGGLGGILGGGSKDQGRVTVRTTPKGAQVLVNGQPVKKNTPVEFFLNPGSYEITLMHPAHKPLKKIITVEKGAKLTIDETLP